MRYELEEAIFGVMLEGVYFFSALYAWGNFWIDSEAAENSYPRTQQVATRHY